MRLRGCQVYHDIDFRIIQQFLRRSVCPGNIKLLRQFFRRLKQHIRAGGYPQLREKTTYIPGICSADDTASEYPDILPLHDCPPIFRC